MNEWPHESRSGKGLWGSFNAGLGEEHNCFLTSQNVALTQAAGCVLAAYL